MKNIKLKILNENGITLIALMLTIVILIILVGVSINVGTSLLDSSRLQGFYTELEIIQKRIDEIATTNKNYNNLGTDLTATQLTNLNSILVNEGSELMLSAATFRYFTINQLESILGLSDMKYNVFVDFDTRTVIAEEGITINETTYHILNSGMYYIEQDVLKNDKWKVSSLKFNPTAYGKDYYYSENNTVMSNTITNPNMTDTYKIIVTPYNYAGEEINGGILKYKKTTNDYYDTANDLEFIIKDLVEYDIIYEDNNRNVIEVKIKVWINGNDVLTVTVL